MQIFTAIDIALMGDNDPQFGQTYYGTVEEQSNPVRFNLKQVVDVAPGRKFVAAEVEHRTSKGSGKPYTQLKKVSLSESTDNPPTKEHPAEEPMSASLADEWTKHQPVEPPFQNGPPAIKPTAVPESVVTTPQTGKDRPDYENGTNARWAIGMAYRAYQQVMGTPEDGAGNFPFDVILLHARELIDMFDILTTREGGE